jgi:phage shock protein A
MDPEILVQITSAKSLSEMKKAVIETVKAKKLENNQIAQLQQALQEAQSQQQQLQKQLEKSTQQIIKFNEKKLAIEEQNNAAEQQLSKYKIDVQKELKERELTLIENRNKIEAMELLDNNPQNDEVLNRTR